MQNVYVHVRTCIYIVSRLRDEKKYVLLRCNVYTQLCINIFSPRIRVISHTTLFLLLLVVACFVAGVIVIQPMNKHPAWHIDAMHFITFPLFRFHRWHRATLLVFPIHSLLCGSGIGMCSYLSRVLLFEYPLYSTLWLSSGYETGSVYLIKQRMSINLRRRAVAHPCTLRLLSSRRSKFQTCGRALGDAYCFNPSKRIFSKATSSYLPVDGEFRIGYILV